MDENPISIRDNPARMGNIFIALVGLIMVAANHYGWNLPPGWGYAFLSLISAITGEAIRANVWPDHKVQAIKAEAESLRGAPVAANPMDLLDLAAKRERMQAEMLGAPEDVEYKGDISAIIRETLEDAPPKPEAL